MSSMQQSFNAGQTQGQTQATTEEWIESIKNPSNEARDCADNASQSAHQGKEEAAGFLQQTGEQMKHMAQEAMDTVKNTLGMGDKK